MQMANRRQFLKFASAGLAFPIIVRNEKLLEILKVKDIILTEEALQIHRSAILIDGHNDLPSRIRKKGGSLEEIDLMQNQPEFQTDIPRMRKGGVGAQFWIADGSIVNKPGNDKSGTGYCLHDIGLIYRMVEKYPNVFKMAYTSDDILSIHGEGKIASLIGIEGGSAIENSLNILESFYQLGARYLTLTWNSTNDLVDSATDKPRHAGLSESGKKVVLEMNRLGMLVDISHISAEAMRDVLRVSQAPIFASHSAAFKLASSPRNVPDDVLLNIAKKGGIVMVNFFPGYLTPEGAKVEKLYRDYLHVLQSDSSKDETDRRRLLNKWDEENPVVNCSVENVVDHIDHIVNTAGLDYVGIGSDFEGIPFGPEYLNDVSYFPYITQLLLNRGYKKEAIHKILGGNFIRVFQEVGESFRK